MKNFLVTLNGSPRLIKADAFQQVDEFITFYSKSDDASPVKMATALVRLGPGDSVIEERKLADAKTA